mgnify:CR=1 FL=1
MNSRIFIAILFLAALAISLTSGYFSIVGLMDIFPGGGWSILIMGVALELAKLVTASWVYRYWNTSRLLLKAYFILAVILLSTITSMGIFGYLSKAHIEQNITTGNKTLQISVLNSRITNEQKRIADAEAMIQQLDQAVTSLTKFDRIRGANGAIATRQNQAAERKALRQIIDEATRNTDALEQEKYTLESTQLALEADVGPVKYIAELFYGNNDASSVDRAVRILIIILMCVFDPLAILLVVATNISLQEHATPPKKDLTLQDVASIIDEPIATSVLKGLTPNNASTHGMDVVLVDKDNIRKMT